MFCLPHSTPTSSLLPPPPLSPLLRVVMERDNIISMPSIITALHYYFASYYIFNISFPPQFRPVLLFLEMFVYGLKPSQKTPLSVTTLIHSLEVYCIIFVNFFVFNISFVTVFL